MIWTKLRILKDDCVFLLIIFLLLVKASFAGAAPFLDVSPQSFDFGEVAEGTPAMVTFVLRNSGDAELVIQSVASS